MSHFERHVVTIEVDASGDGTGYTPVVNGEVREVIYVKDDYANGSTFTITGDVTGKNIWTESNVDASTSRQPRAPNHDAAGAASLYAATGEPVEDRIAIAEERIKIVVASGGVSKSGTFHVIAG